MPRRKKTGHENLKPRYGVRFCAVCGVGTRHWTDASCFTCQNVAHGRRAPTDDVTGTLSRGHTCDACIEFCVCDRPRVAVKDFPGSKHPVLVCKTLAEQTMENGVREKARITDIARTAQKVLYAKDPDPEALSDVVNLLGPAFFQK